jgi:hypothetical protein
MELQVCEVSPTARECFHGLQRDGGISGNAQVIAVDVNWMRQLQSIGGIS